MTSQESVCPADKWIKTESARDQSFSLLTIFYGLGLTIFSLSLELWTQDRPEMDDLRLVYNMFMLCVGLAVMLYYYAFLLYPGWLYKILNCLKIRRSDVMVQTTKVKHLNNGATSLYLRFGAVALGVVAVFFYGLKIYVCIRKQCCKPSDVFGNILQPLFVFIQMHFIFCNSQMTVVRSCRLAKLGAMHLVALNLWTWFRMFLEKQKSPGKEMHSEKGNYTNNSYTTDNSSSNGTDEEVIVSLYTDTKVIMSTCVVELSLIGAAVMMVLWVSIGRAEEGGDATPRDQHRKKQVRVDCSSSSTGFFVGLVYLLVAVADMALFDVETHVTDGFATWSIDAASIGAVLIGCLGALWRMRKLSYSGGHHGPVELLDEILLIFGLIGELVFCSITLLEFFPTTKSTLLENAVERDQILQFTLSVIRLIQVLSQSLLILFSTKLVATGQSQDEKPGKQFITFLLIANIALFFHHTYKTQRASIDGLSLLSNSVSMTVLKAVNPLVTFYRFHSSICLADLWKRVYTNKDTANRERSSTISSEQPSRGGNDVSVWNIRERAFSVAW